MTLVLLAPAIVHAQAEEDEEEIRSLLESVGVEVSLESDPVAILFERARTETDPWKLDRLARACVGSEIATPLFREWALDPSPMLRYRAVEHALSDPGDEAAVYVRAMWNRPAPCFLRAALIRALDMFGEIVHVDACHGLAFDPDYELAAAAIDCVAFHGTPDAVRTLVRRALEGDGCLRSRALDRLLWRIDDLSDRDRAALESLEILLADDRPVPLRTGALRLLDRAGSERAVAVAKRWLRETEPRIVETAIEVLRSRSTPEIRTLLLDRASSGDASLRVPAIRALRSQFATPAVDDFLLAATDRSEPTAVRLAAIDAMKDVVASTVYASGADDGPRRGAARDTFVSRLAEMAWDDPDENVREIADNAERMLREGLVEIVFGCGSGRFDPCDFLVLEPLPGASTVRCWKAPDIEAEPGEAFRALAGRSTHAFDRFEEGAERWRRIVVQEVDGRACWVRDERLRRIGLSEAPPGYPEPAVLEFDLPVDRVRSESFVRLEEWGVVRTFDPGDTLVGVTLSVDPADEIGLELLRTATGWSETPLGEAVRAILPEIESRHGTLEGWEAWTLE